jgi:hypothetical protein
MKKTKNSFAEELVSKGQTPKVGETYQTMFGEGKVVNDFLPSPEDLVLKKSDKVKVTLTLDKQSVDFFKKEAKKHNSPYQRMIRNLISEYTAKHSNLK